MIIIIIIIVIIIIIIISIGFTTTIMITIILLSLMIMIMLMMMMMMIAAFWKSMLTLGTNCGVTHRQPPIIGFQILSIQYIFLLQKVGQNSMLFCQLLPSNSDNYDRLKHFNKDPGHANKPQRHKITTVLSSDLLSPCNAIIFQKYFWFSRFCEFHSEPNPSIVLW